jgi:predicted dinucleotide-binding enzyme
MEGDASGSDVVLLAVPNQVVPAALAGVTGLAQQVVIDVTNRLDGGDPPSGYGSVTEYVKAKTGPRSKAFNLNCASLFDQAGTASAGRNNIWLGDEDARAAVEQLSRDIGMHPFHGGPLEYAATQEAFAFMLVSIVRDLGEGPLFYQFAAHKEL